MTALMYHDVVPPGAEDTSGFPGRDAARYKLTPEQFAQHLDALVNGADRGRVAITFDDGGIGALRAADLLEQRGLRGWFFVTANYVGKAGFLDARDLRDLHARGHVIGSHSCSHPLRMAHCSRARIRDEWTRSRALLGDAIGEPPSTASVPGGDYAPHVAEAAAAAGYATLFTSEPTSETTEVDGIAVCGRYVIKRGMSAETAAALAAGARMPALRQAIAWNMRKAAKRIAGTRYLDVRRALLHHGHEVRWGDG
jgi:peptidoglycan/xylan/chitin deacetylase (PgdA/CDA1 family)